MPQSEVLKQLTVKGMTCNGIVGGLLRQIDRNFDGENITTVKFLANVVIHIISTYFNVSFTK